MQPCLIVYYSRSGMTAKAATALARACGADVERIRDVQPRTGMLGFLRSGYEALRGKTPAIDTRAHDPANYALTILGTPVWVGHVASPLRTYLVKHRQRLNRVAVFCTMGGSGAEEALADIAALCGKQPAATLALTERQIRDGQHEAMLAAFARRLVSEGAMAPPAQQPAEV
ncbi:flavodoxin family protein [Janthinobacterium fluminis]|uniref:Flavodoxin n=1 Tax=Janthinobacterium fluminis TaxID=2987524 RepID=A0ABT5JW13_9BURK|nr:flavodoxin [Janthinobacterium fluminis]MDC8756681.1 flavodoxin [Janthinobacterium fluminis]